jgi:hypothetical protein
MNVREQMRARALAEFDRLSAEREAHLRADMTARGWSSARIDAAMSVCMAELKRRRAAVARLVSVELMKAGVPLETEHVEH